MQASETERWISYIEADIGRRDERQRFLWTIFAASLAAGCYLASLSWKSADWLFGMALAAAAYRLVAEPLVSGVQANQRPPVLGAVATIDEVIIIRYIKRFGLQLSHRVSAAIDTLALLGLGIACGLNSKALHFTPVGITITIAGVVLIAFALTTSMQFVLPRSFVAAIIAKTAAVRHRDLRGTSGKASDEIPGLKELRTTTAATMGTSWKEAKRLARMVERSLTLKHFEAASAILAVIGLASQEGTHAFESVLFMGGLLLLTFSLRLGILLHTEFARAYMEQLLFMLMIGRIQPHQVPYGVALVHALSQIVAQPPTRMDLMWAILEMDRLVPAPQSDNAQPDGGPGGGPGMIPSPTPG